MKMYVGVGLEKMCVGAESIEIGGEGVLDKGCRC
jgi:hypothetical protein